MKYVISAAVVLLAACWGQAAEAGEFRDGFEETFDKRWFIAQGAWEVRDGVLATTGTHSIRKWDHLRSTRLITRYALDRGRVRVRAMLLKGSRTWGKRRPREHDFNKTPRAGVILAMRGGNTDLAVVFGPKEVVVEGRRQNRVRLGRHPMKTKQWYDLEVSWDGKVVTAWVDGTKVGSAACEANTSDGWVGLVSFSDARFDDFRLQGRFKSHYAPMPKGTPKLSAEFTEWRGEAPGKDQAVSPYGTMNIFLRNTGDAPAILESLRLGQTEIAGRRPPKWVAYVRQRPYRIEPGRLGVLEVRLRGIPEKYRALLGKGRKRGANVEVIIRPQNGEAIRTAVSAWGSPTPPAQINFLAFSEDLRTVYAYIEKTSAAPPRRKYHIEEASVDGLPERGRVRLGSDVLADDVVPIEITLPKPLQRGRPTLVTVRFREKFRIGHSLRAFRSQFHIGIDGCFWSRDPGKDVEDAIIADLHNRGFNTTRRLPSDPKRGIHPYQSVGNRLAQHLGREGQNFTEYWTDEVDKQWGNPIENLLGQLRDCYLWYHVGGREYPQPTTWNIMNVLTNGRTQGYLYYPDAVRTSYGWYACNRVTRESHFGRLSGLATSEYRMARRPMRPYFRDHEIFIPVDSRTKKSLYPTDMYQRCVTPKESRWFQYGTLMWGAKSFVHWGYWAAKPRKGAWYDRGDWLNIRAGYGGLRGRREVWGYKIDDYYSKILADAWDAVARVNAEMRTAGPLIARSDVTDYARVTRCTKQKAWKDGPSVSAAALLSGTETMLVVALNMSLDLGGAPIVDKGYGISVPHPPKFPPAAATIEVTLPERLTPKHIFRVSSRGIEPVRPAVRRGRRLIFRLDEIVVSDMLVLTSRDDVYKGCVARMSDMHRRLRAAGVSPEPTREDPVHPLPKAPRLRPKRPTRR